MLAFIHPVPGLGPHRLVHHEVLGLPLLELRLREGPFPGLALRRGLSALERAGCRRLLEPCPQAAGWGWVSTRGLWQAVAPRLALAALEARGLDPAQSVVGIHAARLSRSLLRCCGYLAPRVRSLALSPQAERLLGWELERTYGLPLTAAGADVTLAFERWESTERLFALAPPCPDIPGFTLKLPGLEVPEGCPELPLLSELWEQGRTAAWALQVTKSCAFGLTDGEKVPIVREEVEGGRQQAERT